MAVVVADVMAGLQWGHGISAVESTNRQIIAEKNAIASMGPRHLCRGIELGRPRHKRHQSASMGPRHLCRGIHRSLYSHYLRYVASMGPRHLCRGIPDNPAHRLRPVLGFNGATASLPWNHARAAPAGVRLGALQWGHGISAVESLIILAFLFEETMLQWGHGISAVESPLIPRKGSVLQWLQWGHGISAVESVFSPLCRGDLRGFNGATASLPWNPFTLGSSRTLFTLTSMGPRHLCRGICPWDW